MKCGEDLGRGKGQDGAYASSPATLGSGSKWIKMLQRKTGSQLRKQLFSEFVLPAGNPAVGA